MTRTAHPMPRRLRASSSPWPAAASRATSTGPRPICERPGQGRVRRPEARARPTTASNAAAANRPIGPQNPAVQPYTNTAPPSSAPIPGERTNPSGSPQPGAVPTPASPVACR